MSIFSKGKLAQLEAEEAIEKKHTILIVDDEEANLVAMSSVLQNNYNLLKANGGQEALDIIKGMDNPEKISVVISDQRMPCVTGVMLFQELSDIIPKTVRIIVTGFIDVEAIIDSVNKAHIYRFILKPFERAELLRIIARAVEKYESQLEREEYVRNLEERVVENSHQLEVKNDELNRAYQSLEALNMVDRLTKFNSRAFLSEHLEADIEDCTRRHFEWNVSDKSEPLVDADMGFFMLRVDHLKDAPEEGTCPDGDRILAQVKGVVLTVFSETDFLIRWSEDELLIVARFMDRTRAEKKAEQLRENFAAHNFSSEEMVPERQTCSIGFACYPFDPVRPQLLNWMQLVEMSKTCLNGARHTQENTWVGVESNPDSEVYGIYERFIANPNSLVKSEDIRLQTSMASDVELKW